MAWQIQNQTSHRAKIYYSYGSDTMLFNTTEPSFTEGTTSAILGSSGLIVSPGSTLRAESSLVAAGGTPLMATTQGVHLGQLPGSAGVCVRLVSYSSIPAALDFGLTDYDAFSRGSIRYFYEPSINDRMFFATDGVGIMCLSKAGCVIGPNLVTTSEAESGLVVTGARTDANPLTPGLHFGLQGGGDYANLALAATGAGFASRLDFTFAGQSSSPTLRIQANHTRSLAQLLLNDPSMVGLAETQVMSMNSTGVNFGQSTLSPQSALQVTGAMVTGVPSQSGITMGMVTTVDPAIVLNGTSSTAVPYISWTYKGSTYAGTIFYNCLGAYFTINTGSGVVMTILNSGCVGMGTQLPVAPVHAAGRFSGTAVAPISLSQGVLLGMDPITTTTSKIVICAGNNSGLGIIDFAYAGQRTTGTIGNATTNCGKIRIQGSMNTGQLNFYTLLGFALMIDGSTNGNNCVIIGPGTSPQTAYKLHVTGAAAVVGTLTATNLASTQDITAGRNITCNTPGINSGVVTCLTLSSANKTFDIPHPTIPGMRLRHRCMESDKARLYYEFTLDCSEGVNAQELPHWFDAMNTECRVYCSPVRHFGQAWGEVVGGQLQVTVNSPGAFNVLVTGVRSDQAALDEFASFGVEYPDPNVAPQ